MPRRTYVPKAVDMTHELTMYMVRNHARIVAALLIIDAEAVPAFEAALEALQALDALKETLNPLLP